MEKTKINNFHEKYMQRCLQLAEQGLGNVAPNPMVGSVIVYNNEIIGEGYHRQYGQSHAEVNAITSVKKKELLAKSTLYVNLEPCAHFGKTPPCADLIIQNKIPRVIIANTDPFEHVNGRGIEKLKNVGIEVETGILEKEAWYLNRRFFTFHTKNRPYIILKWAQSSDGFIDSDRQTNEKPVWLTNTLSKILVHKWRSEEQSILVGTITVLKDNPQLTIREWFGKNPLRISFDSRGKIPSTAFLKDNSTETLILENNSLENLLKTLREKKILSVFVEGGARLLQSFIDANLWDEARVFTGKTYLEKGIKSPTFDFIPDKVENIGNAILKHYRNSF